MRRLRACWAVSLRTLFRSLARSQARDYRGQLATAAWAHSVRTSGTAALVLYDVTTLHFERGDEDELRKVGMSKEHRVDPQVQAGLLVDPAGFPLEVHLFEGNKAETTTLIPVLSAFAQRHGVRDMVVVADAGMLSAVNLNALEDAGFGFIVGSRITKARTTWPSTSNGTATTSPTGRSWSRPGGTARARPPGSGGWSANGSSSASSTTTRPSTP